MTRTQLALLLATQNGLCANPCCRISLSEQPFHIDHRVPRAKGGPAGEENLQLLCANCNTLKRDLTERQFRRWFPKWREQFLRGCCADGMDRRDVPKFPLFEPPTGLDGLSQLLEAGRRLYYFEDRRYGSVIVWRQSGPANAWRLGKRLYLWVGEAVRFPDHKWRWVLHIFGDKLSGRLVRVDHRDSVPEWLPRSLMNEFRRKYREQERRKLARPPRLSRVRTTWEIS